MFTREIKFRAWNNHFKEMLPPLPLWQIARDSLFGDFIYLQYTGLKDKNRREIYEGDIVEFIPAGKTADGTPWKTIFGKPSRDVVIFKQGIFSTKDFEPGGWNKYYKVIGNIYENPELLEN